MEEFLTKDIFSTGDICFLVVFVFSEIEMAMITW